MLNLYRDLWAIPYIYIGTTQKRKSVRGIEIVHVLAPNYRYIYTYIHFHRFYRFLIGSSYDIIGRVTWWWNIDMQTEKAARKETNLLRLYYASPYTRVNFQRRVSAVQSGLKILRNDWLFDIFDRQAWVS